MGLKVKKLIEILKTFPEDAIVYAYEGEATGIGIRSKSENEDDPYNYYGFIYCGDYDEDDNKIDDYQ